jgi:hypothetical protein
MTAQTEFSTIGIRLEFEREFPEFYLIAFNKDAGWKPCMQDGKILLMTNRRHGPLVAKLAGLEQAYSGTARNEEVWFSIGVT